MTRVTNFGRKRTHVEATFSYNEADLEDSDAELSQKGVYPNGGSCKLCGETDHLARNCKLRDNAVVEKTAFFGTGAEAGADEDDFHSFKRKSVEVDKEQKAMERAQKSRLKNPPQPPGKKKVVSF